jgi:hypothetical protein
MQQAAHLAHSSKLTAPFIRRNTLRYCALRVLREAFGQKMGGISENVLILEPNVRRPARCRRNGGMYHRSQAARSCGQAFGAVRPKKIFPWKTQPCLAGLVQQPVQIVVRFAHTI